MESYKTNKVFTPTSPAILTFVERDTVNEQLVDAMMTPGMQIIVYGPTGGGKTTLILNKLNQIYENFVVTKCMKTSTFESIVLDAFDQLNPYYTHEKITKTRKKVTGGLGANYLSLKAIIQTEYESEKQYKIKRFIPPQLTIQRLANFYGDLNCCWILEDFHKVDDKEKIKISQSMKVFMDSSVDYPDVKIIAIGAVGTARQVIEYDSEMENRVTEIYVPLMLDHQIEEIIEKGENLLNVKVLKPLKKELIKYASGSGSICHRICLNMCFSRGLYETSKTIIKFKSDDLTNSITKYIKSNSDTLKKSYDKATTIHKKSKYKNPKLILKAIIASGKDEISRGEIYTIISKEHKGYPHGNLSHYLGELISPNRGDILLFDDITKKYSFSNPFIKAFCLMKFKIEGIKERDDLTKKIKELTEISFKSKTAKNFETTLLDILIKMFTSVH